MSNMAKIREEVEDLYTRVVELIDQDQLAQAEALILEQAPYLQFTVARDLARDSASDSAHALTHAHALVRPLARDRSPKLASTLESAHDSDRAHTRARDLTRDLTRTRDLDLTRARDNALALDNALTRDLDSANDLTRDITRARDSDFDSARDLDLALTRDLTLDLDHALKFNRLILAVLNNLLESTTLTFKETFSLTPLSLVEHLAPYLHALADLQHFINQLEGTPLTEPKIIHISQHSPLEILISGVLQARHELQHFIVPALREDQKHFRDLEIEEKEPSNQGFKLDLKRNSLRSKASRITGELAEDTIKRHKAEVSQEELLTHANELLPILSIFIESPLELKD